MGRRRSRRNKTRVLDILLSRQKGRCHYCGAKMTRPPKQKLHEPMLHRDSEASIDHLLSKARGGSDLIGNLVASCRACNWAKGSMPYLQFQAWIRAKLAPIP